MVLSSGILNLGLAKEELSLSNSQHTVRSKLWSGDVEIFVINANGTGVYSTGQEGYSPSWGG